MIIFLAIEQVLTELSFLDRDLLTAWTLMNYLNTKIFHPHQSQLISNMYIAEKSLLIKLYGGKKIHNYKGLSSEKHNKYRIDTWLEGFNLLKHPWEARKC